MSAIDLLTKAIEYDVNGRKMEAMKLYETGIGELMKMCKGKHYFILPSFISIQQRLIQYVQLKLKHVQIKKFIFKRKYQSTWIEQNKSKYF